MNKDNAAKKKTVTYVSGKSDVVVTPPPPQWNKMKKILKVKRKKKDNRHGLYAPVANSIYCTALGFNMHTVINYVPRLHGRTHVLKIIFKKNNCLPADVEIMVWCFCLRKVMDATSRWLY